MFKTVLVALKIGFQKLPYKAAREVLFVSLLHYK